jgi:hypothetical protein
MEYYIPLMIERLRIEYRETNKWYGRDKDRV